MALLNIVILQDAIDEVRGGLIRNLVIVLLLIVFAIWIQLRVRKKPPSRLERALKDWLKGMK